MDVGWFFWLKNECISRKKAGEFPVMPGEQEGQQDLWLKLRV